MIAKLPTVIPVSDPEQKREILAALILGEQEITEGIGYDFDEVLAEADRLLRPNTIGIRRRPAANARR